MRAAPAWTWGCLSRGAMPAPQEGILGGARASILAEEAPGPGRGALYAGPLSLPGPPPGDPVTALESETKAREAPGGWDTGRRWGFNDPTIPWQPGSSLTLSGPHTGEAPASQAPITDPKGLGTKLKSPLQGESPMPHPGDLCPSPPPKALSAVRARTGQTQAQNTPWASLPSVPGTCPLADLQPGAELRPAVVCLPGICPPLPSSRAQSCSPGALCGPQSWGLRRLRQQLPPRPHRPGVSLPLTGPRGVGHL